MNTPDSDLLSPDRPPRSCAVFGSAFDPPHRAHGACCAFLAERHDLVLAVPSFRHAFGKRPAAFPERLLLAQSWAERTRAPMPEGSALAVDPIERDLASAPGRGPDEPVTSIELLRALRRRWPGARIVLAIGPDNADPATFSRFSSSREILSEFGVEVLPETAGLRSSRIREILASGSEPPPEALFPETLAQIRRLGLYGTAPAPETQPGDPRGTTLTHRARA